MCNSLCKDFEKRPANVFWNRLMSVTAVETGCMQSWKRVYNADFAHREYRDVLSEARSGLSYSEEEIRYLDEFISPLIRKSSLHTTFVLPMRILSQ